MKVAQASRLSNPHRKPSDYQPNGTRVDGIIDSLTNTDTDTSYFPNTPPQSPPPNQ
jgi:hypothetical protein